MEWKYVKPLMSNNINEFEQAANYTFPEEFKKCVTSYNGGRPDNQIFNTDKTVDRKLKSFLSFNKTDKENIWQINGWNNDILFGKYVAFAIDDFGNLICFDYNNSIIFLNHNTLEIEYIASNFTDFLNALR